MIYKNTIFERFFLLICFILQFISIQHVAGVTKESAIFDIENEHINNNNLIGKFKSDTIVLDSLINYEYLSEEDSVKTRKTVIFYELPDKATTLYYTCGKESNWLKEGKIVEKYNDYGKILFSERFRWNNIKKEWEIGLWYWNGHQQNRYNENGLLVETIEYTDHNDIDGSIVRKIIWEYDENNNVILYSGFSIPNENSALQKTSELNTVYDNINDKRVTISKNWNYEYEALLNSSKEIVFLDSLGNEIVFEKYFWDLKSNIWKPKSKSTKLTSSVNQTIEQINQKWNELSNNWMNARKTVIETNQNTKTTYEYNWQEHNNKWYLMEAFKIEKKENDSIDFDFIETSYVKHDAESNYIPSYRKLKKHDEKGREITGESYRWNSDTKKWEFGSKHETLFDDKNNTKIVNNYRSQDSATWELSWRNIQKYNNWDKLLFTKDTYFNQEVENLSGRATFYYYSEYEYAINPVTLEKSNLKVTVYPNPSSGIVNINGLDGIMANISVFNIKGQKILETKGYEIRNIDLSKYDKGVYLIHIEAERKFQTTTILVR